MYWRQPNRSVKVGHVDSRNRCETPVILLHVNSEVLSAFVDTGSSVSLIARSALQNLGLEDKVRKSQLNLVGISNHKLEILGQVTATVSVSRKICIKQNFIVVPDEYLTSEILMGADLIGRAKFSWTGQKKELYWGGQYYRIAMIKGHTVRQVRKVYPKFSENPNVEGQTNEEKWLHVGKYKCIPPGKMGTLHITNRHFMPGQVICLEKNKAKPNLRVDDSCYVVDNDRGIYVPFTNSSSPT